MDTVNEDSEDKELIVLEATSVPAEIPSAPVGVIYNINSTKATFGELWRDSYSATVVVLWVSKILRIRLPGFVADPNVETLAPFEMKLAAIPANVRKDFASLATEFKAAGFQIDRPICHGIIDMLHNNLIYMATFPNAEGNAVGRIIVKPGVFRAKSRSVFGEMISGLADGRILWTTAAKKTLDVPEHVILNKITGARPAQLWEAHKKRLYEARAERTKIVKVPSELCELVERHHELLRDLHLQRGLFEPMKERDRIKSDALNQKQRHALASGSPDSLVLAEIQRLQDRTMNPVIGIVILVVSLLVFLGSGLSGGLGGSSESRSWQFLGWLVLILFVHESGHYLAMRIFRYRNVRMFFIPFFGAAVSGRNYSAPGWKKVIVSLMGPLPGILAGGAVGIVGIVTHNPTMVKVAFLALVINGFNLIPVFPLDGGRVMQTLLFSRHFMLDALFRVLAAAALLAIGFFGKDRILLYVGIALLVSLPLSIRLGKVAYSLRKKGIVPGDSSDQSIPDEVALEIIRELRESYISQRRTTNRQMAQHSLTVYEMLASRPTGWIASIFWFILYGGSVVGALVLITVLAVANGTDLTAFIRAAASGPKQSVSPQTIQYAGDSGVLSLPHDIIVANFAKPVEADNAYADLQSSVPLHQCLEKFGQTLMACFPKKDDASRQRWIEALQEKTKQVFFAGKYGVSIDYSFIAPAKKAEEIENELHEYTIAPEQFHLIAPWSPVDTRSAEERRRNDVARWTYYSLAKPLPIDDARQKKLWADSADAVRLGDATKSAKISRELADLSTQREAERMANIRATTDGSIDQSIVKDYTAIPTTQSVEDDGPITDYSSAHAQAIAAKMGQIAIEHGKPAQEADRFSATYGGVSRNGLLIIVKWSRFTDLPSGGPALVNWLAQQQCISIKYQVNGYNNLLSSQ